jgi:hypothetical protein
VCRFWKLYSLNESIPRDTPNVLPFHLLQVLCKGSFSKTLHETAGKRQFRENNYTSIRGGQYRPYTSKALGFTALEDLAEAAAVILMEGPEKHSGKDYFFSADALTPQKVAESLTAATGRKFTAAVLDAETFLNETTQPGFNVRTSVFKGRIRILQLR